MQPGSRALICTEKPTGLQEGQNFKPTFLQRSDAFGSPLPPPSLYLSFLIDSFENVLDSVKSVNSVNSRSSIPVKSPPTTQSLAACLYTVVGPWMGWHCLELEGVQDQPWSEGRWLFKSWGPAGTLFFIFGRNRCVRGVCPQGTRTMRAPPEGWCRGRVFSTVGLNNSQTSAGTGL